MAADLKTAQPLEYYRQFLKEDIRPDGRSLLEFRQTTLNVGSISTAEGSALVKLGNTTAVCGIKTEYAVPKPETPKQGFIVPNVDLPPLCLSRFRPGPPSEQAQVLSQFILDTITNCQMVNLEDLCIVEGKVVWVLYVDIICLDYDGNVTDACMTAMVAALQNTKLYTVTINEETLTPEATKQKLKALNLRTHPVSTTFGIFEDSVLFADPTDEEECLASGIVTVVVTSDDKLAAVYKPGGTPIPEETLQQCFKEAVSRAHKVQEMIETAGSNMNVDRWVAPLQDPQNVHAEVRFSTAATRSSFINIGFVLNGLRDRRKNLWYSG